MEFDGKQAVDAILQPKTLIIVGGLITFIGLFLEIMVVIVPDVLAVETPIELLTDGFGRYAFGFVPMLIIVLGILACVITILTFFMELDTRITIIGVFVITLVGAVLSIWLLLFVGLITEYHLHLASWYVEADISVAGTTKFLVIVAGSIIGLIGSSMVFNDSLTYSKSFGDDDWGSADATYGEVKKKKREIKNGEKSNSQPKKLKRYGKFAKKIVDSDDVDVPFKWLKYGKYITLLVIIYALYLLYDSGFISILEGIFRIDSLDSALEYFENLFMFYQWFAPNGALLFTIGLLGIMMFTSHKIIVRTFKKRNVDFMTVRAIDEGMSEKEMMAMTEMFRSNMQDGTSIYSVRDALKTVPLVHYVIMADMVKKD